MRIPRFLLPLMASALLASTLVACGGGSSADSPALINAAETTMQSTGQVVDAQGSPVVGAAVAVISRSTVPGTDANTTTDAQGRFALKIDAATPAVLRIQKTGFASSFRAAPAAALNASVASRVVLLPVAAMHSFDPAQAAVLRVPGSAARVDLAAGSLVRKDGQPISGVASVALTPINPSADIDQMPGLLVDSVSGEPIESLGALTVEFTDATGAPLNLASGRTAIIRIPATQSAGATAALPATFPLYSLNETTGRWTREGTASLQTDAATGKTYYEGTVSHFSTWNADQIYTRTKLDLSATLGGLSCQIPSGLSVIAVGLDYNGQTRPEGGNFFVRANSEVRLLLLDANYSVSDVLVIRSAAAGLTTRLAHCLSPAPQVQLSGRVVLSSGSLEGYRVQIRSDFFNLTLPLDAQGRYSTKVMSNAGAVRARLVFTGVAQESSSTSVSATVAASDVSLADLTVAQGSVSLSGCVQGWSDFRQSSALLSLMQGSTLLRATSLSSANPSFRFTVPIQSSLSLVITPPDTTLAERIVPVAVGNFPVALGECLSLPKGPQAQVLATGSGLARSFDARSSIAGDASLTLFVWDFGDGVVGSGPLVSHTYAAAGSYPVRLTLTDALGQQATSTFPAIILNSESGGGGGGTTTTVAASSQRDSGFSHTCFIDGGGGASCIGYGAFGQLGDGIVNSRREAVSVTGLASGVVAVSAGGVSSCALTSGGAVKCWGSNSSGQLGSGSSSFESAVPVDVQGLGSGVVAISVGASHACAVINTGAVKCWGANGSGQLGTGNTTGSTSPVAVVGLTSGVVAVSAGGRMSCALTQGGAVFCWGNSSGTSTVPVAKAGLGSDVASISVGEDHGCAVTTQGAVKCWGLNSNGELGNGTSTASDAAVDVVGLGSGFQAVSSSNRFTCALSIGGQTHCWGDNFYGQLGDGTTTQRRTPVVSSIQGGTAISVSNTDFSTCVVRTDRIVQCWGFDDTVGPPGG